VAHRECELTLDENHGYVLLDANFWPGIGMQGEQANCSANPHSGLHALSIVGTWLIVIPIQMIAPIVTLGIN
jgi:hypothetical protein